MPAIVTPFPQRSSSSGPTVSQQNETAKFALAPARRRLPELLRQRLIRRQVRLLRDEQGAVTAEYAIVILAAVAFAGLLVAIMRSDEVRAMLVQLVQNALGAGG